MLELQNFCFSVQKDGEDVPLLDQINFKVPKGHFMAIVGPSGCGKTTLLNAIAGLNPLSEGAIFWDGKNLETDGDLSPAELGYVPQFSIAYDALTVDESIEAVTRLRVKTRNTQELDARIDRVLEETGLSDIADRPVKVLSGGQKRRLGLAMELVTDPHLLLCDEVTSGLDPRSERDIVHRLHDLSRREGRIVISVTHSLAHLELYDSILVLHEGRVAYHGPPSGMVHYFDVADTEEIYPRLSKQSSKKWHSSWLKHSDTFYQKLEHNRQKKLQAQPPSAPLSDTQEPHEPVRTPGFFSQFFTLLSRRAQIFFRDRGQVALQLAILICFPCLVALFASQGNEALLQYPDSIEMTSQDAVKSLQAIGENRAKVGGAVSGIIMFQVVLLALMGSNNAAREIAGERMIFEKEKFGGVRPFAYLCSKLTFLSVMILIQSAWMAYFVDHFWHYPAASELQGFSKHLTFLILINAAMTSICLGISSLMKTSEKASLLSIYLVGFQLPLSGAVLALPESIGVFTRPLISSYWAWAGSIDSLDNRYQAALKTITETPLNVSGDLCLYILGIQITLGIIATYIGIHRHQWDH